MQQPKSLSRRDSLIDDERLIQEKWDKISAFIAKPDNNTEKVFVTFPYCYMNGTLHLGHAYTISKVEFYARFKELCGYNVLFPFGFHGTGMPIVACAGKLVESLTKYDINTVDIDSLPKNDQISILYNMKVPREEIPKFIHPVYWLKYFPVRALEDVKKFGARVDYRRSFVTTDLNPHYDSFIKWQFEILNNKGYLKFGKKPIIYSPKDGQPCADHDRSKGEGVGLSEYNIFYVNDTISNYTIILTTDKLKPLNTKNIKSIIVHPIEKFIVFTINDRIYVAREQFVRNLKYQTDKQIKEIGEIHGKDLFGHKCNVFNESVSIEESKVMQLPGSGFKLLFSNKEDTEDTENSNVKSEFTYYEPEDIVISRSGDLCVVAITDQWFIDYRVPALKQKVNDYIDNKLNTFGDEVKRNIRNISDWIQEWPCSRSYGLGTKLLDTKYVIDSLSDSTIYMAYYTVAHKIIEIPVAIIQKHGKDIWDYIFKNGLMPYFPEIMQYKVLLEEMRAEFRYWYPVDLRVSGKDLVGNHLTMCLYNHAMVWDNDDNKYPKSYCINGYVNLNGEKMSKSGGIFMTLADAIEKYGTDATRLALAEAGTGIDDANFMELNANSAVLKLSTEKEWCYSIIDKILEKKESHNFTFWDEVFEEEIKQCVIDTEHWYNQMEYQKVLVHGFYKMLSVRDNYRTKYEPKHAKDDEQLILFSEEHMLMYLEHFLLITYPICPHFVECVWDYADIKGINFSRSWPKNVTVNTKMIFYRDVINSITSTARSDIGNLIKRIVKKGDYNSETTKFNINITFYNTYSEIEIDLLKKIREHYNNESHNHTIWKEISGRLMQELVDKKMMGNVGRFVNHVQSQVLVYGNSWFEFVMDCKALCNVIDKWVPILLKDKSINNITIHFENGSEKSQFKNGPNSPIIKVEKAK